MTQLLEQAYAQVAQLPETDQDAIAALILEQLQQEALAQLRAGLTPPHNPYPLRGVPLEYQGPMEPAEAGWEAAS